MTSEALKGLIGRKGKPQVYEVTRTDIRKIADAAGDRNPLYWDDEYAAESRYGGLIAPPDFFGWPVKWGPGLTFVNSSDLFGEIAMEIARAGYTRAINAGMESEYYLPIRPGDTIIITSELVGIEEKEGKKGGKMLISTIEMTMVNQNGDLVARQRHSGIH
ncbi:MAG: MaoC family dehydratase N-terminal domain-containing protein [Dehalococcoidia bacterium]|nr:MaoC family dehydratase N-terminal domain-containing protein [Dehalococcoidia bacterium]MDD5495082.1 MaoC family dehydratase N-terminal domain-containing protein [Dehalococcoidia bacterium]